MLAPIVTKEMKLFPNQPLPHRIKNVRSRAQSLQDFANGNAIHVSTSSTVGQNTSNVQNAMQLLNSNNDRSIPIRSRNSRSIGSLPTNTVLATGYNSAANNSIALVPSAKTSPKYSTSSASLRKPLDSIVEGVELVQGSSVDNTVKSQNANVKQTQSSSSREEGRKTLHICPKTESCPHRSSHDDGLNNNKRIADKEKRAQRTHSMEGGRKKRNEARGSNSSAGCFSMWLSSKFRKSGNGESSESNSSTATIEKKEKK